MTYKIKYIPKYYIRKRLPHNMIFYEVNLHVDAIAADEYAEWLGSHIEQILDIEGFQKAEWFVCDSNDDKVHWAIRYHLDSRKSLVNYQKNHAPALIQEGIDKFGKYLTSDRRVMQLKN
tara:strand:- start:3 stop:359 length:357 start_codon:yes stop_codon:yes gene_type:complete